MDCLNGNAQLGPIRLPINSEIITDGDEEIFFIYTELQGSSHAPKEGEKHHGLGYLDSSKDLLEIYFDLLPEATEHVLGLVTHVPRGRKQRRKGSKPSVAQRVEIELFQDTTSLRSRKGDTGSVVWKASLCFAQLILQQHCFPTIESLFNYDDLRQARCLELGSGTGMLSVLLSPLVKQYVATDIPELAPLIQKNVWHNFPLLQPSNISRSPPLPTYAPSAPGSNIEVRVLDWISIHTSSASQRQRVFPVDSNLDLILVVDCIYHPTLIPPLLSTIGHLAVPGKTCVLVLSELRSDEVLGEFLSSWVNMPGWEIWHVGGNLLHDKRYILWVGWKPVTQAA